jgi:pilus assembly protein Flp/PilA
MAALLSILRNRKGATAVEYGLIAALVSIGVVTILQDLGASLSNTFSTVRTVLDVANLEGGRPPNW